jgi:hypothetical protein
MSSEWLRPHTMGGLDPTTARFAAVRNACPHVRSALSRACVKILYCAQHPERRHRRRRNRTFEAWLSSPFILLGAGCRAGKSYRLTAEDPPSML